MDKSIKIQEFTICFQSGNLTVDKVVRLIECTFNIKFNLASHRRSLLKYHGTDIEIRVGKGRHYVLK